MSTTMYPDPQQFWIGAGDPDSILILGQGGVVYQYDIYVDSNNGNLWQIINTGTYDGNITYTGCEFALISPIAASGDVTLSLGSATVSYSGLVSGQKIELSYETPSGVPGAIYVSSFTAGTGFDIGSTSLLDDSIVHWKVLN
jgi:hypothetical protein